MFDGSWLSMLHGYGFKDVEVFRSTRKFVVFRGLHESYGVVAIKAPRPCIEGGSVVECRRCSRLLLREAGFLRELRHDNIVRFYDLLFVRGDVLFMVLEFCPSSLKDLLSRRGRLSVFEAIDIVVKVGRAVKYLHELGISHGDIKPSNILFSINGVPKLSDFTIAVRIDGNKGYGDRIGYSPDYAAPEQLLGKQYFSTDVYQLAELYYEIVMGVKYKGSIVERSLPLIITRALSSDPLRRPSITEFIEYLEKLIRVKSYLIVGDRRILLDPRKRMYVIGRSRDVDLRIDSRYISKVHCKLVYDEVNGGWFLVDEGSHNGTVVLRDGRRIIVNGGVRMSYMGIGKLKLVSGDKIGLAFNPETGNVFMWIEYVEENH